MIAVAIESLYFGRTRRKRPTVPHSDETKLKLAANAPRAVVSKPATAGEGLSTPGLLNSV